MLKAIIVHYVFKLTLCVAGSLRENLSELL